MAYLPLIPQATDQISVSQGNILNNFTILGAIAGNGNASSASINTTSGFNWLYLPVQPAAPPAGAAFGAGVVGLYSFLNATSGRNELYINKTNFSGLVQIASTASTLGTSNPLPGVSGGSGYTLLPSGIKLVWGTAVGSLGGSVTINMAGDQVFANTILSVQCTIISPLLTANQSLVRVASIAANSFVAVVSIPGATAFSNAAFMFFCIGY